METNTKESYRLEKGDLFHRLFTKISFFEPGLVPIDDTVQSLMQGPSWIPI
jgi:hypothetical protein